MSWHAFLLSWLDKYRIPWIEREMKATVTGPVGDLGSTAIRVDFGAGEVMGRITLWESGACDVEALSFPSGDNRVWKHFDFEDSGEAEQALSDFMASLCQPAVLRMNNRILAREAGLLQAGLGTVNRRDAVHRAALRTTHSLLVSARSMAFSNDDVAVIARILDEIDYCFHLLEDDDPEFEEMWRDHIEGIAVRHPQKFGSLVARYEQRLFVELAKTEGIV
jgi:hypothetical protein